MRLGKHNARKQADWAPGRWGIRSSRGTGSGALGTSRPICVQRWWARPRQPWLGDWETGYWEGGYWETGGLRDRDTNPLGGKLGPARRSPLGGSLLFGASGLNPGVPRKSHARASFPSVTRLNDIEMAKPQLGTHHEQSPSF